MGTEPESVYAQKGTMQDVLANASRRPKLKYVQNSMHVHYFKETSQSLFKHTCLKTNIQDIHCSICTCILSPTITVYSHAHLCLHNNRCFFFRRLKINHESHEFTLDLGTVATLKTHSNLLLLVWTSSDWMFLTPLKNQQSALLKRNSQGAGFIPIYSDIILSNKYWHQKLL